MSDATTEGTLQVQGFTPYAQVPRWILRAESTLSHGAVRLYGVIMTYADNDTRSAFPGREKLATDMGASVATIKRAIRELEEFGAMKVERRRNKRTGNFYANHYTMVFQDPRVTDDPPPRVTDDPVTIPKVTTPTSFTSDAFASDPRKEKDTFTTSAKAPAPTPPKNPGGLSQGQRKILRGQLVTIGKMLESGKKFYFQEVQEQWDKFIGMMEDAFPDEFDMYFADLLINGKWTVGAKVATPYGAGRELNTLISTALNQ